MAVETVLQQVADVWVGVVILPGIAHRTVFAAKEQKAVEEQINQFVAEHQALLLWRKTMEQDSSLVFDLFPMLTERTQ